MTEEIVDVPGSVYQDCGLTGLTFKDPSLVRTEFAAESDIYYIVDRFLKTGVLPNQLDRSPIQDATVYPDNLQDLLNATTAANQAFEMLPVSVRNQFNGDPMAYAEFLAAGGQVADDGSLVRPAPVQGDNAAKTETAPVPQDGDQK